MYFTTVEKRTTARAQQKQRKKKEEKNDEQNCDTKRTKNMSTSLEIDIKTREENIVIVLLEGEKVKIAGSYCCRQHDIADLL